MKKRFSNNKGFSLVELIIVVAIMAVLIGILAPQYLKYVEKSRVSADNDYIDSIRKACESVCADPSIVLSDTSYTITIKSTGVTVAGGSGAGTDLQTAIGTIVDISSTTAIKSKTYQKSYVEIKVDLATDTDGDGVADPKVVYDSTNCPK